MKSGNLLLNKEPKETGITPPNPSFPYPGGFARAKEKWGKGDFSDDSSQRDPDAVQSKEKDNLSYRIVILGIGNVLLSDEGVGVHVASEIAKMDLPSGVSVVEGGTDGFRLLNVITEADRLIIIDAVKGGADPGSIYCFDIDEVRSCPSGFKTSVHQIGILEVIDLSGLIGKTPHTTVIGIEPKSLDMAMELSPEIMEKVPRIIQLVMDKVKRSIAECSI
jgi:hydrogenase maturation protease